MKWLTTAFGIELCAYAIMSNHYHCILVVDSGLVDELSAKQVEERWTKVYKNDLGIRHAAGETLEPKELEAIDNYLPAWRRLSKEIKQLESSIPPS